MHFIRENLKPLFMEQHHGQLLPAFNICEQTILFLLPTLECSKANLRQNLVHLWVFQKASAVGYYIFHVSGLFMELQPPEKHMNHKWPWLILVFTPAFVTCEQYPSCAKGFFPPGRLQWCPNFPGSDASLLPYRRFSCSGWEIVMCEATQWLSHLILEILSMWPL